MEIKTGVYWVEIR